MMKARDCGLSWDIFLLLELLFVQGLALELKQDFLKQYLVLNVKCSRTIAVGNDVETANMKEQNHRLNPLTFHRISLPNHRFLLKFIPPFIFCSSFNQQVPSNLQQFPANQVYLSNQDHKISKYSSKIRVRKLKMPTSRFRAVYIMCCRCLHRYMIFISLSARFPATQCPDCTHRGCRSCTRFMAS